MANLRNDIVRALAGTPVAADMSARRYALEAGMRVDTVVGLRPHRVDSADLVRLIYTAFKASPQPTFGALADAIVDHFHLGEEI